jgi:hypothetical protein
MTGRDAHDAKVILHVLMTSPDGAVLLDNTFASERRRAALLGDAVAAAMQDALQRLAESAARAPRIGTLARAGR